MEADYHKLLVAKQRNTQRVHKFSKPPGATLAEHHARYLEERGVTLEVARAAGYWTAWKPSEHPEAFSEYQRRRTPTLIGPYYSPDGQTVSWQKHDDHPGRDRRGRIIKWASPPAEKARTVLSVHPWMLEEVQSGTEPLWVCEGLTRGHALAPLGIAAVTYAGCYSWQKEGEPLPCLEHVNLPGRLVYDVPDADARTNWQVQEMQAARVRYLESRGARVLVVSVPEVNGDEHTGLDDYLAAGGDPEALIRDAQPFVPVDVGRERLKKDDRLRVLVAAKRREVEEELPRRTTVDCNAAKLARWTLENPTPAHGKIRPRGAEIHPSYPQIAEGTRMGSFQTVRKAADRLVELGFWERIRGRRDKRQATRYLLVHPWWGGSAQSVKKEERGRAGKESQECKEENTAHLETSLSKRDSSPSLHSARGTAEKPDRAEKVPALRNHKLVHTYVRKKGKPRGEVVHSDYFKRYGPKCEEIIRHLVRVGGEDEGELLKKYGPKSARLRDFRRRYLREMLDDGVLVREGSIILPAPDWSEALERVRARTDEEEDNRRQSEKYAERRRSYLERLGAEERGEIAPPQRTPGLAGPEKVSEIVADAERSDQAARVEEQRRKVGTTPATFLAEALEGSSGFGWRELRALWIAKGGKAEDLRRAVKHPYRFQREYDGGPLYVERTRTAPEPEREPAPVAVLRETENLRNTEWAAEKASEALHYLARNYPECAASAALREHEEAAHEAAMRGDRDAYLEALRDYCKAGRDEALRIRGGAA